MAVLGVVLAAGGSTRLGHPKQLVPVGGEPLVRRAARLALEAGCVPVRVVLGPSAQEVGAALDGLPADRVQHPHWSQGMASSIRVGVRDLPPGTEGILLLACDQPALTVAHLEALLDRFARDPRAPVASAYAGVRGVPAVFPRGWVERLGALQGDRGARGLLGGPEVGEVPFPGGERDVDRPEDLDRLTP